MKLWVPFTASLGIALAAEPAGVSMTLSASSGIPAGLKKQDWGDVREIGFPKLDYGGISREEGVTIQPRLWVPDAKRKPYDYLDVLANGGPIEPICFCTDLALSFPAIDVKLVNNSKQAIHFSRATIKVSNSAADATPLPLIFSGYDEVHSFDLVNNGWEPMDSVKFEFTFSATRPKGMPPEKLPYERTLRRVKERARVRLSDELQKAGVAPPLIEAGKAYLQAEDASTLLLDRVERGEEIPDDAFEKAEKLQTETGERMTKLDPKLAGPFQKSCWLWGWMTITWTEGNATRTMRTAVLTEVLMFPPEGLGAAEAPTGQYEAMLRDNGQNYDLPIPCNRIVKPGSVDRFVITLGIPRTSRHELKLELQTTAGETLLSKPVTLKGLLPRSAAAALESKEEAEPKTP